MAKVRWSDEVFAVLNHIKKSEISKLKALPIEQKVALPAVKCITALYLSNKEE